jgi:ABC-type transport system involved in cytochrome bd biosynthesis fused ATPase/permease subunit
MQYWKSNETESILFERKPSDETLKSSEDESEDNIIVEVESLYKFYPETNRTVVNNVEFNLYENQITSLLGHNGAGLLGYFIH